MSPNFFDPLTDQIHMIAVGGTTLRQAEKIICACESCHPDEAEIRFDWILDHWPYWIELGLLMG